MHDVAISAQGLGKQYQLGEREGYRALRDSIAGFVRRPFRPANEPRREAEILWALADVSFDVRRGEVMGLIGRNGSGKSTLLKVLSRITEPTTGRAVVSGRVGSLLEVGTGFHPELTGRENVFLNGAILGMQRSEIRRKFDEIIAFAEIERFVDTPVKRYSSGMYVRLAFAVAAHLEPEILLVDEVLAVGDSAFQKKCLGKMNEVAGQGRTVLFVSHDMTNISVLCDTALLLQQGRLLRYGSAHDVIDFYVNQDVDRRSSIHWPEDEAPGDHLVRMTHVTVSTPSGLDADAFALPDPIGLTLEYTVRQPGARLNPVFIVRNTLGTTLFSTANYEDPEWGSHAYAPGAYRSRCVVPGHVLNDGAYEVEALIVEETRDVRARAAGAVEFSVYDDGTTRGGYVGPWDGLVRPRCSWHTTQRVGALGGA